MLRMDDLKHDQLMKNTWENKLVDEIMSENFFTPTFKEMKGFERIIFRIKSWFFGLRNLRFGFYYKRDDDEWED